MLEEKRSPEAQEQFDKPIKWFKENVQCCYNCPLWAKDSSLMFEYSYNVCLHSQEQKHVIMTVWDTCCEEYKGTTTEKNLINIFDMHKYLTEPHPHEHQEPDAMEVLLSSGPKGE